ncbi:hypothetical protein AFI02nite_16430 [Aliivibrio fischeri]|uniref:Uncharacterized protein n=1 Tax=Aliivibrio fischeri TaxID=668 RepID=A0A510UGB2_ALIFS|nr:hypothetical protein AFI02nite_16430 [Aliivibrio fischeri]
MAYVAQPEKITTKAINNERLENIGKSNKFKISYIVIIKEKKNKKSPFTIANGL